MKMIISFNRIFFFAAAVIILYGRASAAQQTQGVITGKVIEQATKQPLPGVNVMVNGTERGAVTDLEGIFTISGVEENVYQLKYSLIGYTGHVENDVRVVRKKVTDVRIVELSEVPISVDSLVVSAGLFSSDNLAAATHYSYSREEIRRSPGAGGDIFRAIETLPGVSSGGGEYSAFAVRGGSPHDNIIMIDNIPFDRVSHFDGGLGTDEQQAQGGRFSMFSPGLIDQADFQAGGFAAKYGGKSASFIDMKIKEGNRESFTVNGTYDLLGWEVNYDGPSYISGSTSLLFSARHQDFKKVFEITDKKEIGCPSYTDVILKTTTEISPMHKITVLGIYSPEWFERTVENIFEAKDGKYDPVLEKSKETKYLAGINWRFLTGSTSFWENILYYKKNDAEIKHGKVYTDAQNGLIPSAANAPTRPDYIIIANSDYQLGWKSQFTFSPVEYSTIRTGIELYKVHIDYNKFQNGLDTAYAFDRHDYRPNPALYYLLIDPERFTSSFLDNRVLGNVFMDWTWKPGDLLTFIPGLRYEYSGFSRKSVWLPRFSATCQFSRRTKISFATGIYSQSPELWLYSLDERNEQLSDEKAVHYILGMTTYLRDDVKFTAEMYYKDLSDLIVRSDRTSGRRINAGSGRAEGVDIGLVKKLSDSWYGQINYSYSVSKRNDNNGDGEYNADFSQPHMFNILFGCELSKEWSFSAKWKYATGRPKDSWIVHENIFNNPNYIRYSKEIVGNNTDRLNDFHTLNVRIDYRHQFGRLAIVAFLDILNLYNRLNVSEEQFNELTGGVSKNGFQIIPTFGLKLEY